MDAVVFPEPSEEERQALLEALVPAEPAPYASAWLRAALCEGVATDEP